MTADNKHDEIELLESEFPALVKLKRFTQYTTMYDRMMVDLQKVLQQKQTLRAQVDMLVESLQEIKCPDMEKFLDGDTTNAENYMIAQQALERLAVMRGER